MVVWCHNSEIIKNGGRYELVTNDKNSSLKIASAKRSDRGEYNLVIDLYTYDIDDLS